MADEGGRVGADAGRLRRVAGVADAWPPRGGRVLSRSERRAGTGAAQRWAGQTRAGLGWAEARWAGTGAGVRWAGFGRGPRNKVAARERRKAFFKLYFQEIFQILAFKYHFEQENDIF